MPIPIEAAEFMHSLQRAAEQSDANFTDGWESFCISLLLFGSVGYGLYKGGVEKLVNMASNYDIERDFPSMDIETQKRKSPGRHKHH